MPSINKIFKKYNASKYGGIDGESSALEPEENFFNKALNLEMSVSDSWRGRVGCQTSGSHSFFGLFPYIYSRTQDQYDIAYQAASSTLITTKTAADGATITKVIGFNQQFWVLDTMNIVITYVSGTYPFTWYTYVSGSSIFLNIKANGVSVLDTNLGDGITSLVSIYSLLSTINAIAELSVSRTTRGTCPPFAVASGTQDAVVGASATYGTIYTLTVTAGHNFFPGDIITFTNATLKDYVTSFATSLLAGGFVVSTTGTTISYVGPRVSVTNQDILGYMGQPASNFPITTVSTATAGNLTISFPYWRLIPEGDRKFGEVNIGGLISWALRSANSFYAPPTATNSLGDQFFGISSQLSNGVINYANNLLKTDNATVVRAGLPAISVSTAVAVGGQTGAFKYKVFLKRIDAQGNIVEGPVSAVSSITLAGQATTVTPTITNISYATGSGFAGRSAYTNLGAPTAIVAGTLFGVDNAGAATAFLQPGDPICISDNVAPLVGLTNVGTLHRTICTKYDGSAIPVSIAVADGGYTVVDNSPISTGLTAVFLRTTAGGNQYYVLCEIPITGYTNFSFTDNVTDAVLTTSIQYSEVTLGKEHNAPPPCTLVCQHQGGLVVARGPFAPNTVAFSSDDGLEYFPTASNSFDVPSTQTGPITAIASDTTDRLAVFKEKSYYDVSGDLDGQSFTVNVVHEGDYGITSQNSLVRIGPSLIGLSKIGYVLISNGYLDAQRFRGLNTRLLNQSYNFAWAVACNDTFNRNYICSIPVTGGEPVSHVIDYSRKENTPFQRDFSQNIRTFERSYATKIDQGGGMALIGDTLYHLSQNAPFGVFRRLIRFNGNNPSGNGDGWSFLDNVNTINYVLETQAINLGEPSQLKTPLGVRLWSLANDYILDGFSGFNTLIETGTFPLASFIGSGFNGGVSSSVSFLTTSDLFKDVSLPPVKALFLMVRLTTHATAESPFWTGFEIEYAESYKKEDLIK